MARLLLLAPWATFDKLSGRRAFDRRHQRLRASRSNGYCAIEGMRTVPSKKRSPKKPMKTRAAETPLENAGEVAVTYDATLPKGAPDKQIHPRRRLPEIPDAPPRDRDQR
jgi:hypothetical protein